MSSDGPEMQAAALEVLQKALRHLASQNRLLLQAAACATQQELCFHILNRTVEFVSYDRAVLLGSDGSLLGVSGVAAADPHSALADDRRRWTSSLGSAPQIVAETSIPPESLASWAQYRVSVKGCSALWMPLGGDLPGLWLERWNGTPWREKELESLEPLCGGYGNLWRRLETSPGGWRKQLQSRLTRRNLVIGALALAILSLLPLRLRIVAPCEVIPEEPAAIAARIDGVVERVLARPGETVAKHQPLVRLETEVVLQEQQSARQALNEAHARYLSARTGALRDPQQRALLPELANRLRQEQARLALADFRAENLVIASPTSGVAVITDPDEWSGRPVTVGERILTVANPARCRVRIFLPLKDKIGFPPDAPVKVILDNDSASSRRAVLLQVAAHASEQPGLGGCFQAEARWENSEDAGLPLGVGGIAIVYGNRVPLAYWLLRRPLSALRGWLGI